MGIILYITAVVLTRILYIPSSLYSIYKTWKKEGFDGVNEYFFKKAISLDQFGNVWAKELFNDTMILNDGYKFGKEDETISSVLGKNKRQNTLSVFGKMLANLLDAIDDNHCIKSIEESV